MSDEPRTMLVMSGPDGEDLAFEDLVDAEQDELARPGRRSSQEADLALGSDIHVATPRDGLVVDRQPLDGIDALLVAYILDLDDTCVDEPPHPNDDARPRHHVFEATKDEPPNRP